MTALPGGWHELSAPADQGFEVEVQIRGRGRQREVVGGVFAPWSVWGPWSGWFAHTSPLCPVHNPLLVCSMDAVERATANDQVRWQSIANLDAATAVRDPYTVAEPDIARPSRVTMAGQGVRVVTAGGQLVDPLNKPIVTVDHLVDDESGCGSWTLTAVEVRWRLRDPQTAVWGSWQPMLDVWAQVPDAPLEERNIGAEMEWEMSADWTSGLHDHDNDPLTVDGVVVETVTDAGGGVYFAWRAWTTIGSL